MCTKTKGTHESERWTHGTWNTGRRQQYSSSKPNKIGGRKRNFPSKQKYLQDKNNRLLKEVLKGDPSDVIKKHEKRKANEAKRELKQ
jgi:hypothetical protein